MKIQDSEKGENMSPDGVKTRALDVEKDRDELPFNMVVRMEFAPLEHQFVMVKLYYYDNPEAQMRKEEPMVMKFAFREDAARVLSNTVAEIANLNAANAVIFKANKRVQ